MWPCFATHTRRATLKVSRKSEDTRTDAAAAASTIADGPRAKARPSHTCTPILAGPSFVLHVWAGSCDLPAPTSPVTARPTAPRKPIDAYEKAAEEFRALRSAGSLPRDASLWRVAVLALRLRCPIQLPRGLALVCGAFEVDRPERLDLSRASVSGAVPGWTPFPFHP